MRNHKYSNLSGFAAHGIWLTAWTAMACLMMVIMLISVMQADPIADSSLSVPYEETELIMPGMPEGESPIVSEVGRKKDFYTCLVAGMDVDETRTDTILIASMDLESGTISLLNIPRDTRSYMESGKVHKINAAHNKGIDRMLEEIKNTVGFYPDNYVIINYNVFESFIDLIGGVEVDVDEAMYYKDPDQDLIIDIPAGLQTLDGENALGYMRFRSGYADQDLGRIRAQQKLVKAVAEKLMHPSTLTLLPKLIGLARTDVETDIGFSEMLWLGMQMIDMDFENVATYTLPGKGVAADYVADETETLALINAHFNPYEADITTLNLAQ